VLHIQHVTVRHLPTKYHSLDIQVMASDSRIKKPKHKSGDGWSKATRKQRSCLEKEEQCQVHTGEEDHARPGWTTSICGQDYPWKSQSEWQRTEINGEYVHRVANPRIENGWRTEQNIYICVLCVIYTLIATVIHNCYSEMHYGHVTQYKKPSSQVTDYVSI